MMTITMKLNDNDNHQAIFDNNHTADIIMAPLTTRSQVVAMLLAHNDNIAIVDDNHHAGIIKQLSMCTM